MVTDHVSNQLRAQAAALRRSVTPLPAPALTIDRSAQIKAEQAARRATAEQQYADAIAEWETLRARISETPEGLTLRTLLDEHKPYLDGAYAHVKGPACEHCDQIGGWEREGVDWPCDNYVIIREGMA